MRGTNAYIYCQQYWGISSYSYLLDTVVVMGLVHHPMYVVVISYPIKLLDFILMHTYVSRCSHMHACTFTRTRYMFIYISTVRGWIKVLLLELVQVV